MFFQVLCLKLIGVAFALIDLLEETLNSLAHYLLFYEEVYTFKEIDLVVHSIEGKEG